MTHTFSKQMGIFALLCSVIYLMSPISTQAYFTTHQSAQKIGNSAILFTVDYVFGSGSYDMELPILTKQQTELESGYLSYQIYDDAEPEENDVVSGEATGLVLSDATISENTTYSIESGATKKMTLVVLFVPDSPIAGDKYTLQVEALPFLIGGTENKLNTPELRPYTTNLISW